MQRQEGAVRPLPKRDMKPYLVFGVVVFGFLYLIFADRLFPHSHKTDHLSLTLRVAKALTGSKDVVADLRKLKQDPTPLGNLSEHDREWLPGCFVSVESRKVTCVAEDRKNTQPIPEPQS